MRNSLVLLFLLLALSEAFAGIKVTPEIKGNSDEISKLSGVIPGVQKVINSEAFKLRVLKARFTDTKDSSEEIYKKIVAADWSLEYEFKVQKNWRGRCPVLGWTYPAVKTVWFNRCNFMGRSDSGIAGTVCHEQMHKLGYGHKSAKSLNSVPYAVGTICAQMFKPSL